MNNADEDIFIKVRKIIANVLNIDEEKIKAESKITVDLGAESLDVVTMLMELEDTFDGKIKDDDVVKFVTVSDVVNYIKELSKSGA